MSVPALDLLNYSGVSVSMEITLSPLSPPLFLVLVSTPSMTVHGNRNKKVILGQPFQIKCHSDIGSFPITYTLKKNHRTLNHTTVSTSSQEAVFTVTIMSEKEIGEFGCEAHNEGGVSAQTSDTLRVQVIGEPAAATFSPEHKFLQTCFTPLLF